MYDAHDPFRIELSQPSSRCHLVALHGELDIAAAPKLSHAFSDLLDIGCERVIVDLSQLSFIDSTGIHTLIAAAAAVEDSGGLMTLHAPNEHVRRVFDVVRLADLIPIEEGVATGV